MCNDLMLQMCASVWLVPGIYCLEDPTIRYLPQVVLLLFFLYLLQIRRSSVLTSVRVHNGSSRIGSKEGGGGRRPLIWMNKKAVAFFICDAFLASVFSQRENTDASFRNFNFGKRLKPKRASAESGVYSINPRIANKKQISICFLFSFRVFFF